MLDFYLQFMLQLKKHVVQKRYYIVHNWIVPILDLMRIDEGNTCEKVAQWGVRNLHSMTGLEDILVLPYNERSHWSIFIFEHNGTLDFDSIPKYHSTFKANQFVKCVMFGWFHPKGIPHNFNE